MRQRIDYRFAVGHARARWPAEALIAQGADIGILDGDQRNQLGALKMGGKVVSVQAPDCDCLVLQRPSSKTLVETIPFLQARGTAVVVDFDDDLSSISPSNVAFAAVHPRNADNNWRHAETAARLADMVTVSTPALAAKYGAHGRVRVLRNCVPDHYLDVTPAEKWDGFGWAGSIHSHPDDLQVLGPTAARLERAGHPFRVIGPPESVGRALGLPQDPPGTGVLPFAQWPWEVARLGVGIAPLADTAFNRQKSAWKPIEMSALSVPWVASDLPEYRRLADMGAGVVAAKPRDWMRELGALLGSEALSEERAGRALAVAETLTYSKHCHEWAEAWADAVTARRAQRSVAR